MERSLTAVPHLQRLVLALGALLALCFPLAGCQSATKPNAPAAPSGGNGLPPAGGTGNDDDSGTEPVKPVVDAGVVIPNECHDIDPLGYINADIPPEDRNSGITTPMDFKATREVGTWTTGCDDPEVQIILSDGHCPKGSGHEVSIWLSARALRDGVITPGMNTLVAEPDSRGITVRYTRLKPLDAPLGKWGSCGTAMGQVVFAEPPDISSDGSVLKARFLLELASCDAAGELPLELDGWFNVKLRRGLKTVCPDFK